jgi:hypothetical protein
MSNEHEEQEKQIREDNMHQLCKHHMYYHVTVRTQDGKQVEGIITDLDKKNVYMLVPQDMMPADDGEQEGPQISQQGGQQSGQGNQRQWYDRPRYRRFFRQIYPLAALAALSLFPYYPPYPYPPYPYPYPYYPPYPYPYY